MVVDIDHDKRAASVRNIIDLHHTSGSFCELRAVLGENMTGENRYVNYQTALVGVLLCNALKAANMCSILSLRTLWPFGV